MTIYSEKTNKSYKTVDECLEDEKKFDEELVKKEEEKKALANKRKEASAAVQEKYKAYMKAHDEYFDEIKKFCKEYGSYHYSIKNDDLSDYLDNNYFSTFDCFDHFFK